MRRQSGLPYLGSPLHGSVRRLGSGLAPMDGFMATQKGQSAKPNWPELRNLRYLQVVADNYPAIKLYEKLGYQRGYEYWYRVLDQRQ